MCAHTFTPKAAPIYKKSKPNNLVNHLRQYKLYLYYRMDFLWINEKGFGLINLEFIYVSFNEVYRIHLNCV